MVMVGDGIFFVFLDTRELDQSSAGQFDVEENEYADGDD